MYVCGYCYACSTTGYMLIYHRCMLIFYSSCSNMFVSMYMCIEFTASVVNQVFPRICQHSQPIVSYYCLFFLSYIFIFSLLFTNPCLALSPIYSHTHYPTSFTIGHNSDPSSHIHMHVYRCSTPPSRSPI